MFTLVIPVFKNEASIPELLKSLCELNSAMDGGLEAVFVVDGSPDDCEEILRCRLTSMPFTSQLIVLSRNFGSFSAIRAGIEHSRGANLAIMAADLQEPPELCLQMRELLESRACDVVIGRRNSRHDPLLQKFSASAFWWMYGRFVQPDMPPGGIDIFGCSRSFAVELLRLSERNSSLVGLVVWLGFRRSEISYDRQPRKHGKSAWSFSRKIRYMLDSTFAFTDLPIRFLSVAGIFGMASAVLAGIIVLLAKVTGQVSVPGYTATVLSVLFFGGLNSFGIGVVGEYVWRTFENTKQRPPSIVAHKEDFFGNGETNGK